MNHEDTMTPESTPGATNRRGALAALLAGSALGLAGLSGASTPAAAKSKKKQRGKNGNGGKGKGGNGGNGRGGKGHGGNGNGGNGNGNGGVGDSLPSVRFVETTTTFTNDGVVSAFSKCPNGYLPISAGFFNSVPNPVLLTSTPRLAENDWEIEIGNASSGQQMTVTVVCLAASDDTTDADSQENAGNRKTRRRSRKR